MSVFNLTLYSFARCQDASGCEVVPLYSLKKNQLVTNSYSATTDYFNTNTAVIT